MSRPKLVATITVILMSALSAASQGAAQTESPVTLSDKQQKVLDYMLNDWNKPMRITGVELAMRNVGGGYSPDDRYAIGVFLRNNPRLHRALRTFGWETAALTPTEKLIARILSRTEREKQAPPTREEFAQLLDVSATAVSEALKMLERFGIMRPDAGVAGLGYRVAEDRYMDWEGAMRITFMNHRVQVEGEKPFEVF
jgi:Bacterial regulatory proteins, gntR family